MAVYVMRPADSPTLMATYTGSGPTYVLRSDDDPAFQTDADAWEAEDPTSLAAFLRQSRARAVHAAGWSLTSHGAAAPLEELAEVYSVSAARPGSSDRAGVVLAGLAAVAAVAIVAAATMRRRRGYVSLIEGTSRPYGSC